jgi:thymidine kinase
MVEPTVPHPLTGWIEVIVGSMYSGKTEELIRRLRRAQIARQRVEIFKPAIDTRYAHDAIVSHSELRIPSRSVKTARQVLLHAHEAQVIGIDEGQFLGPELVRVCEELARQGKRVIVAGLDQDYAGKPFEPMPQLLAIAEYITKTLAICMVCGSPANRTYRKVKRSGRVVVGGADLYEARCRRCYELGRRVRAPEPADLVPPNPPAPRPRARSRRRAAART